MQQIGFKNFRRFTDFPMLDLAPITIFVGENNSGKSSVVKGILALYDFLNSKDRAITGNDINDDEELESGDKNYSRNYVKSKKILENVQFSFNSNYLAHIGTFRRALNNNAKRHEIIFTTKLGPLMIVVKVIGNKKDMESTSGTVSEITIKDELLKIDMIFNLVDDKVTLTFNKGKFDNHAPKRLIPLRVTDYNEYFATIDKDYTIITEISPNLLQLKYMSIGSLIENLISSLELSLNATINDPEIGKYPGGTAMPIFDITYDTIEFLEKISNLKVFNWAPLFRHDQKLISFRYSRYLRNMCGIEYIYAHAVTQTAFYSAKDTNDYLSKTIHEFASFKDDKKRRTFITNWMKQFGIGDDYEILTVGGEAHIVYITNNEGTKTKKVNLSDKGMGSIQLMVLLFRLAILLPIGRRDPRRMGSIIIIEEPEQNLHPALQSKLANLFYNLYKNYNIRFIVETHSEYLIRKSQVLVAEQNYKNEADLARSNPFGVYYFNNDTKCPFRKMTYQTNGHFKESFGPGFYDAAGTLALQLYQKEEISSTIKINWDSL